MALLPLLFLALPSCASQLSEPPPKVRTILTDRSCSGFSPYKGELAKVEPKQAQVHIAGQDAFGYVMCAGKPNWRKP